MKANMNKMQKKARDPRGTLFSVAAAILGLILAGLVILFISRVNRAFYSYTSSANEVLYMLNRSDYVNAWDAVLENRGGGLTEEKDPKFALPYAVTDYFEAASYYNAFENAGNAAAAAAWKGKMDVARAAMGDLSYMTEEIDGFFTGGNP